MNNRNPNFAKAYTQAAELVELTQPIKLWLAENDLLDAVLKVEFNSFTLELNSTEEKSNSNKI